MSERAIGVGRRSSARRAQLEIRRDFAIHTRAEGSKHTASGANDGGRAAQAPASKTATTTRVKNRVFRGHTRRQCFSNSGDARRQSAAAASRRQRDKSGGRRAPRLSAARRLEGGGGGSTIVSRATPLGDRRRGDKAAALAPEGKEPTKNALASLPTRARLIILLRATRRQTTAALPFLAVTQRQKIVTVYCRDVDGRQLDSICAFDGRLKASPRAQIASAAALAALIGALRARTWRATWFQIVSRSCAGCRMGASKSTARASKAPAPKTSIASTTTSATNDSIASSAPLVTPRIGWRRSVQRASAPPTLVVRSGRETPPPSAAARTSFACSRALRIHAPPPSSAATTTRDLDAPELELVESDELARLRACYDSLRSARSRRLSRGSVDPLKYHSIRDIFFGKSVGQKNARTNVCGCRLRRANKQPWSAAYRVGKLAVGELSASRGFCSARSFFGRGVWAIITIIAVIIFIVQTHLTLSDYFTYRTVIEMQLVSWRRRLFVNRGFVLGLRSGACKSKVASCSC